MYEKVTSNRLPLIKKRRHESAASSSKDLVSQSSDLSPTSTTEVDKSHIVGHINKDGSIEPVATPATASNAQNQHAEDDEEIEVDIQKLTYQTRAVLREGQDDLTNEKNLSTKDLVICSC